MPPALLITRYSRAAAALLAILLIGACSPPITPTPPLAGAIVPTRLPRSATPPPTATLTPTDTPTLIPTSTPTLTPSLTPTLIPTDTPSPTATPVPTDTPSPVPTNTPEPTSTPTEVPAGFTSTGYTQYPLGGELALGSSVNGLLSYPQTHQLYTFAGELNQVIDVEMAITSGTLQPLLLVIDPKGREIARFENRGEIVTSAAIRALPLPETGRYVIVAARLYGTFGSTEGTYALTMRESTPGTAPIGFFSQPIAYNEAITETFTAADVARVYTFRGAAGDRLTLSLTRSSGDLDALLYLTDNVGNVLAWNDDDLRTGTTDSTIPAFILPYDGWYSLVASRYLGAAFTGSNFRVRITAQTAAPTTRYAAYDPVNTRVIRADRAFFINSTAGDTVIDGQELRTQALVTLQLPPQGDTPLTQAVLELEPCLEARGGFAVLGDMTVYADLYGPLSAQRDFTRVSTGARIIATQTTCTPIDVTAIVSEWYASGQPFAQFRITFRQAPLNGERDEVLFTPALRLEYGTP